MCGICGFSSNLFLDDDRELRRMADEVAYRGPDSTGFFENGDVCLAHRRLAIIDTADSSKQPFLYMQRYVCVFNGEIYNYKELRSALIQNGYSFRTAGDTEVLVASYDFYGVKCTEHFNGMWAFSIYDRAERTLFCSRDRFGVKPFYYTFEQGKSIFASEIKQIRAILPQRNQIEEETFFNFLANGTLDYSSKTMFKNIFQLPGGYSLTVDLKTNSCDVFQWYCLEDALLNCNQKPSDQRFRELFFSSLELRHRSDVELGYCLSGGLDSSAIACSCGQWMEAGWRPRCVSACYSDQRVDESAYIDCVVDRVHAESYRTYPNGDQFLECFEDILWHMDEPFGSTSVFAQWEVFKLAHQKGIKVMLDGQGADEQLAGYNYFYPVLIGEKIRKFRWLSMAKELNAFRHMKSRVTGVSSLKLFAAGLAWLCLPKQYAQLQRKAGFFPQKLFHFDIQELDAPCEKTGNEKAFTIHAIKNELPSLLHYEDRMSMAFSIESRTPFLDYRLVEHNLNIGIEDKIVRGITKMPLRTALDGILPARILERKDKIGFATPEKTWVNEKKEMYSIWFQHACEVLGDQVINKKEAQRYYKTVYEPNPNNNYLIWRILCSAKWIELFNMRF